MKSESTVTANCNNNVRSLRGHRFLNHEHQLYVKLGVPSEQSLGKLTANSGKPKSKQGHGNPDLAETSSQARVETLYGLSQEDKEKVHSDVKTAGQSASPEPIPAALGDSVEWRCLNLPNSGKPEHQRTDSPRIGEVRKASDLGYKRKDNHDCLYTFMMCKQCSRARWVRNQDLKTKKGQLCRSCSHTTTKVFRNHIERVIESGAKRASELGKPTTANRDPWYYPHKCSICGDLVWHQRKDLSRTCRKCSYVKRKTKCGVEHPNWKGGRLPHPDGYILVLIQPSDPYYPMASERGYVLEHRLVMARHLGRCLSDSEIVHHINGNKNDNRIENLELLPNLASHLPYIFLQEKIYALENKVFEQDKEIRLLKWRIRNLEAGNPDLADGDIHRARVETLQEVSLPAEDEEKVQS